jgi:thioredoxin 2
MRRGCATWVADLHRSIGESCNHAAQVIMQRWRRLLIRRSCGHDHRGKRAGRSLRPLPQRHRAGGGDPVQACCGKCGKALFDGHPVELDEASLARQFQADTPLVVDFRAPWCGPCRMMAPIDERAAGELEPAVRLTKSNPDEQGDLAARFAIRSIPTLAIFKNGREVARHCGVMEPARLLGWVRTHA